MIDNTGEYWKGDDKSDIIKYLEAYSEGKITDTKEILCPECGGTEFLILLDEDEGALQVECINCHTKRLLLDSKDYWQECDPEISECICNNQVLNLTIGFVRRKNRNIKWIYLGVRCIKCGTLGSLADWKINYEPTDELEKNT